MNLLTLSSLPASISPLFPSSENPTSHRSHKSQCRPSLSPPCPSLIPSVIPNTPHAPNWFPGPQSRSLPLIGSLSSCKHFRDILLFIMLSYFFLARGHQPPSLAEHRAFFVVWLLATCLATVLSQSPSPCMLQPCQCT